MTSIVKHVVLAILIGAGAPALAQASAAAPAVSQPVDVMVLGAFHFANPGLDEHNISTESVLTPARQAELDAIAGALAAFRPTHVMVEMVSHAPDLHVPAYDGFDPASLRSEPNEIDQLGFRVAHKLGLTKVYGIDEQSGPGEPDYFPYAAVKAAAATYGGQDILARQDATVSAWVDAFNRRQKTASMADLLAEVNAPSYPGGRDFYYDVLAIGDAEHQAGAELNARWYERNAKIFAKLMKVARPGDRILVVYGAGHKYWLDHFASEVPGYRSVDPLPYLKEGVARRR